MIEIPIGKALAPVEIPGSVRVKNCRGCFFLNRKNGSCKALIYACRRWDRKDGKNVIFKLIDLPKEANNE